MTDTSIPLYGHFTKGGSPLVKESGLTKSRLPFPSSSSLSFSTSTSLGGNFSSIPLLPILPYSTISSEYQLDISLDDELTSIASSNSSNNFGIHDINKNDNDDDYSVVLRPSLSFAHPPQPSVEERRMNILQPSSDTPPITASSTLMTNSSNTTTFLPSYDDIHNHTSTNLSVIQVIQDDAPGLGTTTVVTPLLRGDAVSSDDSTENTNDHAMCTLSSGKKGVSPRSSIPLSSTVPLLRGQRSSNFSLPHPPGENTSSFKTTEDDVSGMNSPGKQDEVAEEGDDDEDEDRDEISMDVINHHTGSLLSTLLPVTPGLDTERLQNIISTLAIEYRKQELLNIHHTSELHTIHQQCNALESRLQSSDLELRKTKETNGYYRHIFEHLLRLLRNENIGSTKNITLASLMEAVKSVPVTPTGTETDSSSASPRTGTMIDTVNTATASSYLSQSMLSLPPLHILRGEVLDVAGQRLDMLEKELLQKQQIINEQALSLRKVRAYQGSGLASQRQEIQRLNNEISRITTVYEARLSENSQIVYEQQQQVETMKRSQCHHEQQYHELRTKYDTIEIDVKHYQSLSEQTANKLQTTHQHLEWAEEAIGVLKEEVHARDNLLNNQAGIIANLEKEIENIRKGNAMVSLHGESTEGMIRKEEDSPVVAAKVSTVSNDESKEIQQLRYLLTSARAETAKAQADAANLRASLINLNHRNVSSNGTGTEIAVQTEKMMDSPNESCTTNIRSSLVEDQAMEIAVLRAQLELARAQNKSVYETPTILSKENGTVKTQGTESETIPQPQHNDEPLSMVQKPLTLTLSLTEKSMTESICSNEVTTPSMVTRIPVLEPPGRPPRNIHPSFVPNSSFSDNLPIKSLRIPSDSLPNTVNDNELLSPLSRQLVQQTIPEVPRNHGSLSLADSLNTSYELPLCSSSIVPHSNTDDDDQDIQLEILQELTNHSNGLVEKYRNTKDQVDHPDDSNNGTDTEDNDSETDDYNNSDWDVEWDSEGELQKSRHDDLEAKKKSHPYGKKIGNHSNNIHISVDTGGLALPSPAYATTNRSKKRIGIPLHVARASPLTPHPFTENGNTHNNQVIEPSVENFSSRLHDTVVLEPCSNPVVVMVTSSVSTKNDNEEEDSWTFLQPAQ